MLKRDLRPFAPIGLYLAGIAALVSGGLYIVNRTFDLTLQISLGVIVLGLALFVLLDPQRTREAFTGRQARYGSNSLLMTVAFVGILVVINYLVFNNSRQWDLTEDKTNTLTPETLQVLSSLPGKVTAEAYYTARMPFEQAEKLLRNYEANSKGRFVYKRIDPEQNPIQTQQANVTRDGTIVLRVDDRLEQVSFAGEQDLTAALVRLSNPGSRVVYFLTGHGEFSIDASDNRSYSQIVSSLNAKNYTVTSLNLLANPIIPKDALAIVIAGPLKPLTSEEINALTAYQAAGGSLVYLAEPRAVTQFGDQPDLMENYLSQTWGISLDDDILIDVNQNNNQPLVVVSDRLGSHAITQRMYSFVLVLPSARSVRIQETRENITLTELAKTTENAWGETDIEALQTNQASPDQNVDLIGPVSFAVAGENQGNKARMVVIGDADFASNGYFQQLGNSDFILNSIDWAAQQDNLISLTPRTPTQRLMLPPQPQTMGLVLLGSVFMLPGLVIITGIVVWIQRRKRG